MDLLGARGQDPEDTHPFKGNMDLDKLATFLAAHSRDQTRRSTGNDESQPLHALYVDADGVSAQYGIPPGTQAVAKRREQHPAQAPP